MQKRIFATIIFLLFAAISSAQVITSKKEAIKKGVYNAPTKSATTSSKAVKPNNMAAISRSKAVTAKNLKNKRSIINDKNDDDLIVDQGENYLAMQMINNAMEFIGVNYRGGGTSKAGMDCSGMVTAVFNIFGMKLPRSSHDMAKVGEKLERDEVKKGDLVFFKTNGNRSINHVGLVIDTDGDDIRFIHSSTSKGVIISSTKEPYYKRTFAQANRVIM